MRRTRCTRTSISPCIWPTTTCRVQYWPQMVSGMSARRLEDSPRDYRYYVTRFDRTYKAHNVKKMALKAPMVVFFSVYFPAKLLRAIHTVNTSQPARRGGQ